MVKSRAQIQRENASKSQRKRTITPTIEPRNTSKSIIDLMLRGKDISLTCNHYRVGSSAVFQMISGSFKLQQVHGRLMTPKSSRAVGYRGEKAYFSSLMSGKKEGVGRKCDKPFIEPTICLCEAKFVVATPDFVYRVCGEMMIAEIKTTQRGISVKPRIPNRTIVQVWIAMDACMVSKCDLSFYYLDPEPNSEVQWYYSYMIEKKSRFFDRNLFRNFLENFSLHVVNFLKFNGLTVGRTDREYVKQQAMLLFDKTILPKDKNYLKKNLFVDKPLDNCKQLTSFVFPWKGCFETILNFPRWTSRLDLMPQTWQQKQQQKLKKTLGGKAIGPSHFDHICFDDSTRQMICSSFRYSKDEITEERVMTFQECVEKINSQYKFQTSLLKVEDEHVKDLLVLLMNKIQSLEKRIEDLEDFKFMMSRKEKIKTEEKIINTKLAQFEQKLLNINKKAIVDAESQEESKSESE